MHKGWTRAAQRWMPALVICALAVAWGDEALARTCFDGPCSEPARPSSPQGIATLATLLPAAIPSLLAGVVLWGLSLRVPRLRGQGAVLGIGGALWLGMHLVLGAGYGLAIGEPVSGGVVRGLVSMIVFGPTLVIWMAALGDMRRGAHLSTHALLVSVPATALMLVLAMSLRGHRALVEARLDIMGYALSLALLWGVHLALALGLCRVTTSRLSTTSRPDHAQRI